MPRLSIKLLQELHAAVRRALERDRLLNVPAIAWQMKALFPNENISIAELEAEVMAAGMAMDAAMLFERPESYPAHPPLRDPEGTTLH
ncbi:MULTISPECIES: hypothetical protein [Chelativorans]|jgi:hypothetical protein|uniref:Uncharacterized protein n=1 Tax=Chelativorans sp. (strain BNC1) TaxID=266779 RepID=Q11HJ5_CHESB|nr:MULTISPECIES: hypothetical protein [Chelativorans]